MRLVHSFYAAAAAVLMSAPAHAIPASPAWSVNASSCSASADSIAAQRYATSIAKVAHRTTNVDQIQLFCAIDDVSAFSGTSWVLSLTYRDSTGVSTSASAVARLIRISRASGNSTPVATFDSNSSAETGVTSGAAPFTHTFNGNASYYYVQILLDRTLASEIVEAYGVAIDLPPP